MPDDFEVGPIGLPLYRYQDWRDLVVERWRAAYGPDADTRPETPDGLIVDTLALLCTLLGEAAQGVYAGSFFRTAASVQLDLILDMFGRLRLTAEPTTVSAVWYGDEAAVVWSGAGSAPVATVSSAGPSDGDRYVLTEAGTLPTIEDGTELVIRLSGASDGDDYSLDIDGIEQSTITTAGPTDTIATLATTWAAAIEADEPTWTATYAGLDASGERGIIVIQGKPEAITVEPGSSATGSADFELFPALTLALEAEETGPQQCLAGTLVGLASAPAGVEGTINLADGSLGRDVETDADFRARHIDQINVGGRGTPQRIRAFILSELPDPLVEYCRVDENVDSVPDSDGRPPHSFETTWIGTATAAQVAAAVFEQKPAGIRAYGDTIVEVEDEVGDIHEVGVSPGTELYLHLDITVTEGEGFPDTGDAADAITEAVVTYLEPRLGLGSDLYRVAVVAAVVGALEGVAGVVVETDATAAALDAPSFSAADITVASNEILRVDSTRVTVTLV